MWNRAVGSGVYPRPNRRFDSRRRVHAAPFVGVVI